MKPYRPHRFPPLAQLPAKGLPQPASTVELQASLADGFNEGLEKGYREGYESGKQAGRQAGHAEGRNEGIAQGRREAQAQFANLAAPVDALFRELEQLREDYQSAMRKEVVELVSKVARQVIRCELALQPTQVLALVDETLAMVPPPHDDVEVYLNPEELQRIRELDPERAARWTLTPDPRLEPGECRVKAGGHEADAGCRQRLANCIEQVSAQLQETDSTEEVPG
jgi:flagellar assembly protein FliH